jgi:hypothetical protein
MAVMKLSSLLHIVRLAMLFDGEIEELVVALRQCSGVSSKEISEGNTHCAW